MSRDDAGQRTHLFADDSVHHTLDVMCQGIRRVAYNPALTVSVPVLLAGLVLCPGWPSVLSQLARCFSQLAVLAGPVHLSQQA